MTPIRSKKIKGIVKRGKGASKKVKKDWPDIKDIVKEPGVNKRYTDEIKTANVECKLRKGIYTGMTKYGACLILSIQDTIAVQENYMDQSYQANIAEVYIIGWEGDLYGKELEIWDIIQIPWQGFCFDPKLKEII